MVADPTNSVQVKENLGTLQASIIPIPNRHPVETILLRTKTPDSSVSAPRPCVFSPHGGPHTTMVTSFSPVYVALALEGCTSYLDIWVVTYLFFWQTPFVWSIIQVLLDSERLTSGNCWASVGR